jgi:2-oxoglutarate ferredoxin oxidoreductase subunit gamma
MDKNTFRIRLSGSGGQGLILGGIILAEAAGIYDNKNVTQSQSYGPEARGGASKSEVIISDEEILFPKIEEVDVLLSLNQKSCDMYVKDLRKNGILIVDGFYVKSYPTEELTIYSFPYTEIATDTFKTTLVVNMMGLGSIAAATGCVSEEALFKAIENRVPRGTQEMNVEAAKIGIKLVKEGKK